MSNEEVIRLTCMDDASAFVKGLGLGRIEVGRLLQACIEEAYTCDLAMRIASGLRKRLAPELAEKVASEIFEHVVAGDEG